MPRDLVAIVAKAMAREPAARYPTAQALADDLKRFATGQLVGARHYSSWALVRRWLRRHRATALLGGALLAALVAGAVGVVRGHNETLRERNRTAAENNRLRLMQARAVLERDPTAAAAWLKTYRVEPGQESRAVEVAASAGAAGVARHVLTLPGRHAPARCAWPSRARWRACSAARAASGSSIWRAARAGSWASWRAARRSPAPFWLRTAGSWPPDHAAG